MSTRFYAGPISSGMGRRWDDWHAPDVGIDAPPRRARTPLVRPHPPAAPPAAPTEAHAPNSTPVARRR